VSNRKSLYKSLLRSGFIQDDLIYRNASAATMRLLEESKRLVKKQVYMNLNPFSSSEFGKNKHFLLAFGGDKEVRLN
jgi:predicted AAA+ superfamily ATPase